MFKRLIVTIVVIALMCVPVQADKVSSSYENKALFYGIPFAEDVLVQRVHFDGDWIGQWDMSAAWLNPIDDIDDVERWDFDVGHTWDLGDFTFRAGAGAFLYSELDADDGFDVLAVSATLTHKSGVRYTCAHLLPENGSSTVEAGEVHILGIDRDAGPVTVFADVLYNDGFSPFGRVRIRDLSHARAGLTGTISLGPVDVRATYYRQHSLDDAIVDEDVAGVSIAVPF